MKTMHRRILTISLIITFLASGAFLFGMIRNSFTLILFSGLFLNYALTAILTTYAIKFQDKQWIIKSTKYATILLPLYLAGFIMININKVSPGPLGIIFLFVLTYMALIYLFIYTDASSLTTTIVLIILLLIGMFLKKMHLFGAGIAISISSALISIGSLIFGIRCLFVAEDLTYFRNVTFCGSMIISVAFFAQMFKLQHWPFAGLLVIISAVSLILATVYILMTLHSSGFIDWKPFHKRIVRKILIPWTLIFILFLSRYMIPELDALIWSPDVKAKATVTNSDPGFGMKDYVIEDKNGLYPH
jgi:hypothetical protein